MVRIVVLSLLACLSFIAQAGNPTVYPYQIDQSIIDNPDFDTVMIATHNLGKPTTSYLAKHEANVDEYVVSYLKKKKIKVLDNDDYRFALSAAESTMGDPYDPSTGRMNMALQQNVLIQVFQQLRESHPDLDAIIFTEIIEREIYYTTGLKRVARWDGVQRSPLMQGTGQGVPSDFNWVRPVDAASLAVYVFTMEGLRVFHSIGGMSLTEAIDTKGGNPKFKRHRNVLSRKGQIKEGVELAFHPWINMKKYPGPKK